MKEFSSFPEEGRDLRDEKQELVSRKEVDNKAERRFIQCPESGVIGLDPTRWAFGGLGTVWSRHKNNG